MEGNVAGLEKRFLSSLPASLGSSASFNFAVLNKNEAENGPVSEVVWWG